MKDTKNKVKIHALGWKNPQGEEKLIKWTKERNRQFT